MSQRKVRPPQTVVVQNSSFFLQPVTFQVDNELFQIPSILFPTSETFKSLYPNVLEGTSPVVLNDCTKEQFEAFLTVILRPYRTMFPLDHPCNHTLRFHNILPALELAKKWKFKLSHTFWLLAGGCIPVGDDIQKIVWGRQYQLFSWVRAGLEGLVLSDVDISLEDAKKIGLEDALRVYHARSRLARELRKIQFIGDDGSQTIVPHLVEEIFEDEIVYFPRFYQTEPGSSQVHFESPQDVVTPGTARVEAEDESWSEGSMSPRTDTLSDTSEYLEVTSVSAESDGVPPDTRNSTTDAGTGNTKEPFLTTNSSILSTESPPPHTCPNDFVREHISEYAEVCSVSAESERISPDTRDSKFDAGTGKTEQTSLTTCSNDLVREQTPKPCSQHEPAVITTVRKCKRCRHPRRCANCPIKEANGMLWCTSEII